MPYFTSTCKKHQCSGTPLGPGTTLALLSVLSPFRVQLPILANTSSLGTTMRLLTAAILSLFFGFLGVNQFQILEHKSVDIAQCQTRMGVQTNQKKAIIMITIVPGIELFQQGLRIVFHEFGIQSNLARQVSDPPAWSQSRHPAWSFCPSHAARLPNLNKLAGGPALSQFAL